jgi:hypothetical protein
MPAVIASLRGRFSQARISFFWMRSACRPPLARLASQPATVASS